MSPPQATPATRAGTAKEPPPTTLPLPLAPAPEHPTSGGFIVTPSLPLAATSGQLAGAEGVHLTGGQLASAGGVHLTLARDPAFAASMFGCPLPGVPGGVHLDAGVCQQKIAGLPWGTGVSPATYVPGDGTSSSAWGPMALPSVPYLMQHAYPSHGVLLGGIPAIASAAAGAAVATAGEYWAHRPNPSINRHQQQQALGHGLPSAPPQTALVPQLAASGSGSHSSSGSGDDTSRSSSTEWHPGGTRATDTGRKRRASDQSDGGHDDHGGPSSRPRIDTTGSALDEILGEAAADAHHRRFDPSTEQTDFLEQIYTTNPHPTMAVKGKIAAHLGVETKKIVTWFSNRNSKRREVCGIVGYSPPTVQELLCNRHAMRALLADDDPGLEVLPAYIFRMNTWTRALDRDGAEVVDFALATRATPPQLLVVIVYQGRPFRVELPLHADVMQGVLDHRYVSRTKTAGSLALRAHLAPRVARFSQWDEHERAWHPTGDFTGGANAGETRLEIVGWEREILAAGNRIRGLMGLVYEEQQRILADPELLADVRRQQEEADAFSWGLLFAHQAAAATAAAAAETEAGAEARQESESGLAVAHPLGAVPAAEPSGQAHGILPSSPGKVDPGHGSASARLADANAHTLLPVSATASTTRRALVADAESNPFVTGNGTVCMASFSSPSSIPFAFAAPTFARESESASPCPSRPAAASPGSPTGSGVRSWASSDGDVDGDDVASSASRHPTPWVTPACAVAPVVSHSAAGGGAGGGAGVGGGADAGAAAAAAAAHIDLGLVDPAHLRYNPDLLCGDAFVDAAQLNLASE